MSFLNHKPVFSGVSLDGGKGGTPRPVAPSLLAKLGVSTQGSSSFSARREKNRVETACMFLSKPGPTHVCLFGLFQEDSDPAISESLSIENALWAGTVIASGEEAPSPRNVVAI